MKTVILIFFLLGLSAGEVLSQTTYEVNLAGYNMIPPVRTAATGILEVTVHNDSLFVSGEFRDLRGQYWATYIHYGKEGETGNRLIQLRADVNEEKNGGELKKERNSFELRPAIRRALQEGNLYVVISSNRNQDGEIRGQIPRM
ncbi:MAG: CHRD domain-containing protein [Balneolaceae bacterium]|nr:MAG: CHRD domain-containing protein [Balneolaceae bacterium]